MTGIGKTTLVEKVYSDPSVLEEFETRLFVHIGPRYNRSEEIVWLVLYQLGITSDKFLKRDYVKQLSEALSNKKYLIVLEDVWAGIHEWHDLQYDGFPDNGKGSRFIIISQIDCYVVSSVIVLPLLKDNESWKLLRQTAFSGSEDKCSRELEKIGKTVAINCEGLPAAIIQVGENLRGKSFQEWKTLSEKRRSISHHKR
ncbi:PREDICTED: disease resistance RPP13-like protein 4 [Erythranthe guttata]|uniref:disease resistance RPP13-like protein 4 n=1 Tax=Erythranthe guttata TaxID=4155 RepID=UPI00064DB82B|nr:PREDICTED: disease resistance RPP13-like protein 4 [Erythranthe guttata]|eukprot:XP_012827306.1 PREDICTED: disease resistance RPP13-like protein 4 [Erythranthe guttata]